MLENIRQAETRINAKMSTLFDAVVGKPRSPSSSSSSTPPPPGVSLPYKPATTVEEDIHLVESVQRGLGSRGYRPGPLVIDPCGGVNSEHPVMHLQKWMRDAIDGGDKGSAT